MTIEQSLLDQQVAIATLIGAGMPAIALPPGGSLMMNPSRIALALMAMPACPACAGR